VPTERGAAEAAGHSTGTLLQAFETRFELPERCPEPLHFGLQLPQVFRAAAAKIAWPILLAAWTSAVRTKFAQPIFLALRTTRSAGSTLSVCERRYREYYRQGEYARKPSHFRFS